MPFATTPQGVELCYDTFGSPSDPPLLMVCGVGAQMITWPDEFCEFLAAAGLFVISFDNRDCGLSQKFEDGPLDMEALMLAAGTGQRERARELAPYTFSEMAQDGVGLLSALGIERAHVLGASLGGMIAQTMAIEHPQRLLTLISVMSSTGEPEYGQATPEALEALLEPTPDDREGYIETWLHSVVWRSKRYPDLESQRVIAGASYDRGRSPEGANRQLAALLASGDRAEALRTLEVPTLVIHGLDDTLIAPSGGERTAELVPGARLLLIEDMGHDRPQALWPVLRDAIVEHTIGAQAAGRASNVPAP